MSEEQVKWEWRGECVRCRHIWFSHTKPLKCPKCGFTHAIMKDKLKENQNKMSHVDFEEERDWVAEEMERQGECYYGAEVCVDSRCRDTESCLGCFVIAPPKKEKLMQGVHPALQPIKDLDKKELQST